MSFEKWRPDRRSTCWLSLVCVIILTIPIAAQDHQTKARLDHASPQSTMVSGFDRFGRYGDISDRLAGSLLISELSCVSCHPSSDDWLQPKRGPRLNGAGNRLQQEWLRRHLADPQELDPATTMPHMLASLPAAERTAAINALVAFLGSQRQPFPTVKAGGALPVIHEFWKRGDAERGSRLYHSVGCVACHEPDDAYETASSQPSPIDELLEQLGPDELAEFGLAAAARRVLSVPHGDLTGKFSSRSLTMMLLDPTRTRPSARMPSLRLTPEQAADIAAYLLDGSHSKVPDLAPISSPQRLATQGRSLFVQLRCSNCHEARGVNQSDLAKPLFTLDVDARSSCIENPSSGMAVYRWDKAQQNSVRALLRTKERPRPSADADVSFRMLQLNCYACHQREGLGGVGRYRKMYFETVGHVDLGDEGRLPPSLDGVGGKLLPQSLAKVFHPSTPPYRHYMTIRMPAYPEAAVKSLCVRLPVADEVDTSKEKMVFTSTHAPAEAGRDLVNTGCVECHPFRGESLPGVVGIDLQDVTTRVYPKWFYTFLLNPGELKQRTRMPTFFPEGKSNREDLLEGNVHRQISAVWSYLKNLQQEPLPEKIAIARSANYELVPKDQPIVLRTFMKDAGTHTIAVGFPRGAHYAFDAEQVRLAIAWKGRFLDARGTWFERFTPPADPLGKRQIRFPAGPLFRSKEPRELRFRGYRLSSAGVPTLLYQRGVCSIEDRVESSRDGGLKRTITIQAQTPDQAITLRPHAGRQLIPTGPFAYADEQGLTVAVPERMARAGSLHENDGSHEWLIPLRVRGRKTVALEYSW